MCICGSSLIVSSARAVAQVCDSDDEDNDDEDG